MIKRYLKSHTCWGVGSQQDVTERNPTFQSGSTFEGPLSYSQRNSLDLKHCQGQDLLSLPVYPCSEEMCSNSLHRSPPHWSPPPPRALLRSLSGNCPPPRTADLGAQRGSCEGWGHGGIKVAPSIMIKGDSKHDLVWLTSTPCE